MSAVDVIREAIQSEAMISQPYLDDLTDEEMLHRPCEGCNHIKWQLGHLIASEHMMMEQVKLQSMPPLPEGFAQRYTKETTTSSAPGDFDSKSDLLQLAAAQREGTLKLLETMTEDDLARESGVEYAPTVQAMFLLQATHWLMHAGQWAVIRRQLGRPPLF